MLSGRRILKSGSIEFGGSRLDCTVRQVSTDGARLLYQSPVWIPDEFVLAVPSLNVRRSCRIVERAGGEIQVTFH